MPVKSVSLEYIKFIDDKTISVYLISVVWADDVH